MEPSNFIRGWSVSTMGKTVAGKSTKNKAVKIKGKSAEVMENPLVPNAVLRQMYLKMVETRMLEERVSRLVQLSKAAPQWSSATGQEACRVSVMQGLGTDDMVLDSRAGRLMDHLLGTKLPDVLSSIQAMVRRDKSGRPAKSTGKGRRGCCLLSPMQRRGCLPGWALPCCLSRQDARMEWLSTWSTRRHRMMCGERRLRWPLCRICR